MEIKSIPNFRIFSLLLTFFLFGVFVSSFYNLDFQKVCPISVTLILLLIFSAILIKQKIIKIAVFAAVTYFIGFLLFSFSNTKLETANLTFNQEQVFSGKVISFPEVDENSQNFYLKTDYFGKSTNIYVSTKPYPSYQYGDILELTGTIKKPEKYNSFDWPGYLKRYGAKATIYQPLVEYIGNNDNKAMNFLLFARKNFEDSVRKSLPEPESSLAIGLITGKSGNFSKEMSDIFSRVGVSHIVALSGYNVTIIIIFLTQILLSYFNRRQIFLTAMMLIIGFVIMTGGSPSVIRASIITLLIAYGKTIGRKADMTNLILVSATIMIILNPFILKYDLGFQLSFLAFIGLIYFSPIVEKALNYKTFLYLPKFIKSALIETLSAQTFVLPLILYNFGLISIIAPISNVLILPIIPMSMLFVFLSSLLYLIIPFLGKIAFLIAYLPLKYILEITIFFANQKLSAISINQNLKLLIILTYCVCIIAIIYFTKHHDKHYC